MLEINAASVVFSLVVTVITVGIWHNLNAAFFSIVLSYAFQCVLAEYQVMSITRHESHLSFFRKCLGR
jgi:hypothetical protein